jgi:REP-associated tyrosine transposase
VKYKKQAHCVYQCEYHLVLVTKYRREVFNEGVFAYFMIKLKEINKYYPEIEFVEVNHDRDHVHMMLTIPPKMSVGSVVRIIKANTSKRLKEKFDFVKALYWGTDGIWSDGYFVSTVGLNEKVIKQYIINQGKEDTGQALLELG